MKVEACIAPHEISRGPDPWDDDWGIDLPLDHVICYDVDGTPHTVGEFIWPWTAYSARRVRVLLHFYYWTRPKGRASIDASDITPEREGRMRELQFLMTRQIFFGNESSPSTLYVKLNILHYLARFAETQSCTVSEVLSQIALLDACSARMPGHALQQWMSWLVFLRQLDPETQLGFTLAKPKRWKELERRAKAYRDASRQCAPLPTRIYSALINNLSAELDDIEAHKVQLLAALQEAVTSHPQAKENARARGISVGPSLIAKHHLAAYFEKHGLSRGRALAGLAGAISDVFMVCKLQIHLFSGMRHAEASHLPYYCMVGEMGLHGRRHSLIAGVTTKFNKGRRLRTKWVTTEREGFRAIRIAQEFADVIYGALGVKPSKADDLKDNYPLFPSTELLPWGRKYGLPDRKIVAFDSRTKKCADLRLSRLCEFIEEGDIDELEEIDPFRAWREEPEFAVGRRWPLTIHQLRRSLAIYANASGLVRLSSLRRQLQHITREMSMYYGRGSSFCKNFVVDNPDAYKKHIAADWLDGTDEAEMLAFVRDVLNCTEPMFGGAGTFYERQCQRGEVMSREDVAKQMKAGLLAYREGPLGGCTRPSACETRKGLNLIDTICATNGCKHLIGKHSKIVQTIRLKRAAMSNITPHSITEAMEREELEALERVEREWRPQEHFATDSTGGNKYV